MFAASITDSFEKSWPRQIKFYLSCPTAIQSILFFPYLCLLNGAVRQIMDGFL